MERTKYTPKRLLSLLLALIMLLGMFPTATLAAGTEDEPAVTPYVLDFDGLTFEFTLTAPDRPFFRYGGKYADIRYTIKKSNDNKLVSALTEFKYGPLDPANVAARADESRFASVTHEEDVSGTNVRVFNAGAVLATGTWVYWLGTADGDADANGKLTFSFPFTFMAAWTD